MDEKQPALGATIRAARRERGWSQEELGFEAGLSQSVISRIERGRPASRGARLKIFDALRVRVRTAAEPR
jgi:transcriptional regulator with XRE-family HTH domain